MERVLSREGYIMTLSSTHASMQEERDLLEALGRQAVRGVMVALSETRLMKRSYCGISEYVSASIFLASSGLRHRVDMHIVVWHTFLLSESFHSSMKR